MTFFLTLIVPFSVLLVTAHILNTGRVALLDIIVFLIISVGATSLAIISEPKQK